MMKEVRARRQVLSPHWSSTAAAAKAVAAAAAVAPSLVNAASSRRYGAVTKFLFCFSCLFRKFRSGSETGSDIFNVKILHFVQFFVT
jgi:hypothetical protein